MNWRINWWFCGENGIQRGHDIIEANEDFDEFDAEDLLEYEVSVSENVHKPKTKKFFKIANFDNFPKTWGVLSVVALGEEAER